MDLHVVCSLISSPQSHFSDVSDILTLARISESHNESERERERDFCLPLMHDSIRAHESKIQERELSLSLGTKIRPIN